MRKYDNFCSALLNLKEIYNYGEPFDNVILTGLVGLYEICFDQSWKMMKDILASHGYRVRSRTARAGNDSRGSSLFK